MRSIFFPAVMIAGLALSTAHPAHATNADGLFTGFTTADLAAIDKYAASLPPPVFSPPPIFDEVLACKQANPSPVGQQLCDVQEQLQELKDKRK
jgi:hypothetical protein